MTRTRGIVVGWSAVSVSSLVGLGLATYLAVVYLSGSAPACGPSGGCEAVTTSEYAVFLGVPVAVLAVGTYGTLLMGSLTMLGLETPPAALKRGLLLLAGSGVGFSAYLTGIEVFVLHAICVYCVASAVLISLIFILILVTSVLGRSGDARDCRRNQEKALDDSVGSETRSGSLAT